MTEQTFSPDPQSPRALLGDMLVADGKLGARDLERALSAQAEMGGMLGSVLIRLGVVSDLDVARALSRQLDVPLVLADAFPAELPLPDGVSPDFLTSHRALPLREEDGVLTVVCAEPQNAFVAKALRLATGLDVRLALGLEGDIEAGLKGLLEAPPEDDEGDAGGDDFEAGGDFIEHLKDLASEAPVIRLVNQIVARVIDLKASDIHLEPFDDGLHVRYRVDGVIQMGESVSPAMSAAVVSRIKLLAHLNIAERRLPQDGRINLRIKGRELDAPLHRLLPIGHVGQRAALDHAECVFEIGALGVSRQRDVVAGVGGGQVQNSLVTHGLQTKTGCSACLASASSYQIKSITIPRCHCPAAWGAARAEAAGDQSRSETGDPARCGTSRIRCSHAPWRFPPSPYRRPAAPRGRWRQ